MAKISETFTITEETCPPGSFDNFTRGIVRFELTAIGDGGARLSILDHEDVESYQIGGGRIDEKTLQKLEDTFREMRFWLANAQQHLEKGTSSLVRMPDPDDYT